MVMLVQPAFAQGARKTPVAPPPAPSAPRGDAVAGRELAESERCIECHGADGQGSTHDDAIEGKFPRLAGQQPDYLLKQLRDLRSGARKNDFMQVMARSIDDATAAHIVAFFAGLPPMRGDGRADANGATLYARGDAARGIPACAACHGADALGQRLPDGIAPRLAGQTARYLERQLLDWRDGFRRNSAGDAMSAAARGLSDAEILSLSHHLSGLAAGASTASSAAR